ncbi:DUF5597 domain-containing protein [Verrucomicrobiota bacterium]
MNRDHDKLDDAGSGSVALPRIERDEGRTRLLVDGKPFVMLGAEVRNSSASSAEYMEPIWDAMAGMNCNTVLVPVYWELVESREGEYEFALVQRLLAGARARGLRLVLLWFGTWKNAECTYVPGWVKQDLARFPRAQDDAGGNLRSISPFSADCIRADARAFAALMTFLRESDPDHTVVMVQVENEAGLLGASRDYSAAAGRAFAVPVPPELPAALFKDLDRLHPELLAAWQAAGERIEGTWQDVFGAMAHEAFMAWHVARGIETVAAAGKAEYPLPLYTNAWLNYGQVGPGTGGSVAGTQYPSGGPVARVLEIWEAAAPSLAALAPDIYADEFKLICRDYTRNGRPLLIPEASAARAAGTVFWAIGEHNALCFAPFGIDGPHPWGDMIAHEAPGLAESYARLGELLPLLIPHLGTDRVRGILQTAPEPETLTLVEYRIDVTYGDREHPSGPGCGIVAACGKDEFLVVGRGFDLRFTPAAGPLPNADFLAVEEGRGVDGAWVPGRRLNGDDIQNRLLRFQLEPLPVARRVLLYRHA